MNAPEKIPVVLDGPGGITADFILYVEERVFADRSAGQWENGWLCYYAWTKYFVSESGVVWLQPDNVEVGIAPLIKAAADRMEVQLAAAEESDHA